ncbi:hypothetical protein CRUP_020959 [Coryphaenoides rupestris]|nr:hypothetical protein CRUP_020959 [Coryphaenoides rupestris]
MFCTATNAPFVVTEIVQVLLYYLQHPPISFAELKRNMLYFSTDGNHNEFPPPADQSPRERRLWSKNNDWTEKVGRVLLPMALEETESSEANILQR